MPPEDRPSIRGEEFRRHFPKHHDRFDRDQSAAALTLLICVAIERKRERAALIDSAR